MKSAAALERDIASAILFEPLTKHWCVIHPLVHHLLDRGIRVTVVAPENFDRHIQEDLSGHPQRNNLTFVPFSISRLHFHKILFRNYDFISFLPRCYRHRGSGLRRTIDGCIRLVFFFAFLTRISKRSVVALELHQLGTLKALLSQNTDRRRFPFRQLEQWLSRRLLARMNAINVLDEPVAREVRRLLPRVPVLILPPGVFTPSAATMTRRETAPLRVVIPGRIDIKRREYDWLLHLGNDLAAHMEVALVGMTTCKEDEVVFQFMRSSGVSFDSSLDGAWVPEKIFSNLCRNCEVMVAPLKPTLPDGRRIGIDTITASLLDAVRFGKPLLFPRVIPIGPQFKATVLPYGDRTELIDILRTLAASRELSGRVQETARRNSMRFVSEKLDYLEALRAAVAQKDRLSNAAAS